MTKQSPAGKTQKTQRNLSRQKILDVALPIVQKQGVETLSFRLLAEKLKVTPMAVSYHCGSKQMLLGDLVAQAFKDTVSDINEDEPGPRIRAILRAYYQRALMHANLLRVVLADHSLMSEELQHITRELLVCTQQLNKGDVDNVLLNLLVDYTHGFVLSASSIDDSPLTVDDFLRGIDWVISRADG